MRRPTNRYAEWVHPEDSTGMTEKEAKAIWHAALLAYYSKEQYMQIAQADYDGTLTSVGEHQTGLEVIEVQFPSEDVKGFYRDRVSSDFVSPTGKLICKRWVVPGASRLDIPKEIIASREAKLPQR